MLFPYSIETGGKTPKEAIYSLLKLIEMRLNLKKPIQGSQLTLTCSMNEFLRTLKDVYTYHIDGLLLCEQKTQIIKHLSDKLEFYSKYFIDLRDQYVDVYVFTRSQCSIHTQDPSGYFPVDFFCVAFLLERFKGNNHLQTKARFDTYNIFWRTSIIPTRENQLNSNDLKSSQQNGQISRENSILKRFSNYISLWWFNLFESKIFGISEDSDIRHAPQTIELNEIQSFPDLCDKKNINSRYNTVLSECTFELDDDQVLERYDEKHHHSKHVFKRHNHNKISF